MTIIWWRFPAINMRRTFDETIVETLEARRKSVEVKFEDDTSVAADV